MSAFNRSRLVAILPLGWAIRTSLSVMQARLYRANPIGFCLLPIVLCGLQPSFAAGELTPTADSVGSESLDEIVVTARRREENLQAVPIAVTVLSQNDLQQNNVQTLDDLQYLVPSMSLNRGTIAGENLDISIRGQQASTNGVQGQESVIVYLNEAPIPGVAGYFVGGPGLLFDLENIQVVKGPQGTLFGRNSVGGDLLLQSARPGNELGGNIQASYGNYNDREIDGAVNLPLVDNVLLARVAFNGQWRDGYTRLLGEADHPNGIDADNRDTWSIRGTITFHGSDGFQNDLIATYSHFHDRDTAGILFALNPTGPLVGPLGGLLAQQQALGIRTALPIDINDVSAGHTLLLNNNTRISLPGDLTLRNIFSYSEVTQIYAIDRAAVGGGIFENPSTPQVTPVRQFTEELQLQGSSFDNALKWTAGLFYLKQPVPSDYTLSTNKYFGVFEFDYLLRQAQASKAAYAQGTYDLSALIPRLKFTAGIRYTRDNSSKTEFGGGGYSICPGNPLYPPSAVVGCGPDTRVDSEASSGAATYTAGFDYQLVQDSLLYLTVSRGYRAGGFNNPDPFSGLPQPDYGPEYVTNFELGIKSDWKIGSLPLRTNADLWRENYTEIQVLEALPDGAAPTANAGTAKLWGTELEATANLSKDLQLRLNFDYLHFAYGRFNPEVQGVEDLLTSTTLNRPAYKYGVSARYNLPVPVSLGALSARATWNWQSSNGDTSTPYSVAPAFGLLNMNVDWAGFFGSPVDVSFFASNVLNKDYITQPGYSFNWNQGFVVRQFGEPRMYGIRVQYRFGSDAK